MAKVTNIESALEAILFVSTEVMTERQLAEMLATDIVDIHDSLQGLQKRYEVDEAGIVLKQIAGGWRLFSNPEYSEIIREYVLSMDSRKLSQAALETVAIIAYSQPVTRASVASGRGVNSDSAINSLLDKGLIREAGQANLPGSPMTYRTTPAFLQHFGMSSLDDLVPIEDFAPDEKTRTYIAERLSATKITSDDQLSIEDDDFQTTVGEEEDAQFPERQTDENARTQEVLSQALSEALGTTEKVDLSKLELNTDDE